MQHMKPPSAPGKSLTTLNFKYVLPLLLLSGLLLALLGSSCKKEAASPLPRPVGWPRIDLPEHAYQTYQDNPCPFTFEYPANAVIETSKADSCWMNLYIKDFECRWHFTYRYIPGSGKSIQEHNEEYRKLVFKHIQKVNQIKETPLQSAQGNGILYELFGTVGVPAQFLFTDSTHLVMASFYFDTAIRNDSLAPVIDFVKEDMAHMAESIVWR